jgi:hypothetical protein
MRGRSDEWLPEMLAAHLRETSFPAPALPALIVTKPEHSSDVRPEHQRQFTYLPARSRLASAIRHDDETI